MDEGFAPGGARLPNGDVAFLDPSMPFSTSFFLATQGLKAFDLADCGGLQESRPAFGWPPLFCRLIGNIAKVRGMGVGEWAA